jgi:hypothetical protein
MRASVERSAFLYCIVVAPIDAGARAADVVENGLGHFEAERHCAALRALSPHVRWHA